MKSRFEKFSFLMFDRKINACGQTSTGVASKGNLYFQPA